MRKLMADDLILGTTLIEMRPEPASVGNSPCGAHPAR
jgi:hypothetical protein